MLKIHNPATVCPPVSSYSHGIEVLPGARWLHMSGQVAIDLDGSIPETFHEQCELAWQNLYNVLDSAGMNREDLVKLTVFMTDPDDLPAFRAVRDRFLGDARPATTLVFISALARPEWKIEIEGVAARA